MWLSPSLKGHLSSKTPKNDKQISKERRQEETGTLTRNEEMKSASKINLPRLLICVVSQLSPRTSSSSQHLRAPPGRPHPGNSNVSRHCCFLQVMPHPRHPSFMTRQKGKSRPRKWPQKYQLRHVGFWNTGETQETVLLNSPQHPAPLLWFPTAVYSDGIDPIFFLHLFSFKSIPNLHDLSTVHLAALSLTEQKQYSAKENQVMCWSLNTVLGSSTGSEYTHTGGGALNSSSGK